MNTYTISQEQLIQLSRIYNTFLQVSVSGENAFVFVDAMRALEALMKEVSSHPIPISTNMNETEIKE